MADLGNTVKNSIPVYIRRSGYDLFDGNLGMNSTGSYSIILSGKTQKLSAIRVNGVQRKSPLERTGSHERMLEAQRGAYDGEFYTPEAMDVRPAMKMSQMLQNIRLARVQTVYGFPVVRGRGDALRQSFLMGTA